MLYSPILLAQPHIYFGLLFPLQTLPAVQVDKKKIWKTIHQYGQGVDEQGLHHVPICALAPTVPRTLVPGAGWNS